MRAWRQPSTTWPNAIRLFAKYALGVDERVAHAGLRRQVDDLREAAVAKEPRGRRGVDEIEALEPERVAAGKAREPRLLQRDVIVRIEVVDAGHRAARGEQALGDVHADEPRGSGDEHAARRAHCRGPAASARSLAYFMKLANAPIAM